MKAVEASHLATDCCDSSHSLTLRPNVNRMCENPHDGPGEGMINDDHDRPRLDAATIVFFIVSLILLYAVNFICGLIAVEDAFEADFGLLGRLCYLVVSPCVMLGPIGLLVGPPIEAALVTWLVSVISNRARNR